MSARPGSPQAAFEALDRDLPPVPKPLGMYRPVVIAGEMAYLSGHAPVRPDGTLVTGRLGADTDLEGGILAARLAGLGMLLSLQAELGTLDRVVRLVKLFGLVRCTESFHDQPQVINGCSELFVEVLGEAAGVGARSAIGASALPAEMVVEIEGIFQIRP